MEEPVVTEDEFARIAADMARGEVLRMISEEHDPIMRALLARDMPKIVAALVERSLRLSAPAFRAEAAERERLRRAERDGALH